MKQNIITRQKLFKTEDNFPLINFNVTLIKKKTKKKQLHRRTDTPKEISNCGEMTKHIQMTAQSSPGPVYFMGKLFKMNSYVI